MALYAFDGTGNEDDNNEVTGVSEDSNVRNFYEAYTEKKEYIAGVGTRYGALGKFFGGLFGAGGETRIEEMFSMLETNWKSGDRNIDIIGFSRGAALAVHFANVIKNVGLKVDGDTVIPEVRFLGLWDIVGAFGIPRDIVFKFQSINIGYDLTLADNVNNCFHAMSLHERRDCFKITRLNKKHIIEGANETWFRGVHSDVGGGLKNSGLESISLSWMFDNAINCGLPISEEHMELTKQQHNNMAPVSHNPDIIIGPRRRILPKDVIHSTATGKKLDVGESSIFLVDSKQLYNWSGVSLEQGFYYTFEPKTGQVWCDASIECDTTGWKTENELSGIKEFIVEHFEDNRRCTDADWFELIGTIGDDDKKLFRIGAGGANKTYQAIDDGELYAFANDMLSKYGNNEGVIEVTVTRVASPGSSGKLQNCC
ncbi:MAG: DUF2235 domain-containing protein [Pseudomonadota bacterium]